MKYLKLYENFSKKQIKKGLKKSISNNDIDLKTNIDNVISNIENSDFAPGSVESFLEDDNNFIPESLPDNMIKYIEDNNLDIDISDLKKYLDKKKQLEKIEKIISDVNHSDDIDLDDLYRKYDDLEKYIDLLNSELIKIKRIILDS